MTIELEGRIAALEIGLGVALEHALSVHWSSGWSRFAPQMVAHLEQRIDAGDYADLSTPEGRDAAKVAIRRLFTAPLLSDGNRIRVSG